MQALGSVDSVRTYDCCHPSTSSRVEGIEPWETHVLRIHGTFENGATSLSGISTLPHVISRSMTGTVHGSPPGQICGGLDRLIDQVGDATVSWGIDIPAMWHCTHENGCLGPNDPVPTPPAYWELPLFCEQGTDYYDMVACGTWLTEVFEDDPNS